MIIFKRTSAVLAISALSLSFSGCAGGEIGMVGAAMREVCSSLPSDLKISGPDSSNEMFVEYRRTIYLAEGGGQSMYWDILDSSDGRLSMTTAYAGNESVAASWGCPTDIVVEN